MIRENKYLVPPLPILLTIMVFVGILLTALYGWQFALIGWLCAGTGDSIVRLYRGEKNFSSFGDYTAGLVLAIIAAIPYFVFGLFWINLVMVSVAFVIVNYYIAKDLVKDK